MIGLVIAYAWLASIAVCLMAAVWTEDLRFLGTAIILVAVAVLPIVINKSAESREKDQ